MARGGRPATGSIRWRYNVKRREWQWFTRVTLPSGKRSPWIELDPSILETEEHRARACAKTVSDEARATGAVPVTVRETLQEYAARWLAEREGRINSIRDDRARLACHVYPLLGTIDVRALNRDDLERLRDDLDARIVRGRMSWKTAANVWTLVTRICDDMVSAKKRELRVRQDNPSRDVKPPDRGARKAKQYLFPSEFLQFVSCERIPLRWRRAVALAIYTFARDGELRALTLDEGDLDLDHGTISITRAWNQNAQAIRPTKTGHTRRFAIEPALMPLLDAIHDERGGKGPLLMAPSDRDLARNLRRWLRRAGVRRPELHHGSPTRKPLTWHDLRATGLTWMAVRGDDPLKIMQRAGHTTFGTTQLYVREAEAVRDDFGSVFPSLPACLLGLAGVSERVSVSERAGARNRLFSRGPQCEGRDLNPDGPDASEPDKQAGSPPSSPAPGSESARASATLADRSAALASTNPQPLTLEVLRAKLDAAIVAEQWNAVAAIRERIVQAEREAAGNVVPLDMAKRRRGAS